MSTIENRKTIEITEQLLNEILKINLEFPVTIEKFTSNEALAKGENFLSVIYRVLITLTNSQEYHWIVKVMPKNDLVCQFLEENKLFQKENEVYNKWLQEMIELCQQRATDSKQIKCLWPKSYKSDPHILVMDDMKSKGFQMLPRQNQLNLEQSLLVIRNIGRFHAYTLPLIEKYPNLKILLGEAFFKLPKSKEIEIMFKKQQNAILSCIDYDFPEFKRITTNLRKILDHMYEIYLKMITNSSIGYVWCHGDLWLNNILFKFDDNDKPIECCFVDFQLGRVCSPVLDLHYFAASSIKHDVWLENETRILKEYYESFTSNSKSLNIPVPFTFEELQREFEDKYLYGFFQVITITPVLLVETDENLDIEFLSNDINSNSFIEMFKTRGFRKLLPRILEYYEKRGCFGIV